MHRCGAARKLAVRIDRDIVRRQSQETPRISNDANILQHCELGEGLLHDVLRFRRSSAERASNIAAEVTPISTVGGRNYIVAKGNPVSIRKSEKASLCHAVSRNYNPMVRNTAVAKRK